MKVNMRLAGTIILTLLGIAVVGLLLLTACSTPASPLDESKAHFEQGNTYLNQGAWDRAIVEFSKVITLNPELEAAALIGRGIANSWGGEFEQAEDDFHRALRVNSGSYRLMTTDAYVAWGIASTVAGGSHALGGQEAEYLFDSAISNDPNNADAYTGRALMHLKEAYIWGIKAEDTGFYHLSDAISDFEKAIELDPLAIRGRTKRFNFKDDMAFLPNYIKANNEYGAVNIGVSGYRYYDRALEAYTRVLKGDATNVEALIGQGNAFTAIKQSTRSILSFASALEQSPSNSSAYAGRAIAYTKEGQYDLAITDFETAVTLDKRYAEGKYDDVYATPGVGFAYPENVIGFASAYIKAYTTRGYELLKQGEFELAIRDLTAAISCPDGDVNSFTQDLDVSLACGYRGIAYTMVGAYKQALNDFEIANYGERFDMFTEAFIARAIAYSWTGNYRKAIEDFEHAQVYANFSMDAGAYLARGYAYKSGYEEEGSVYFSKEQAIADFKKFIALAPSSPRVEEAQRYISQLK